jgi:hypothetical protein
MAVVEGYRPLLLHLHLLLRLLRRRILLHGQRFLVLHLLHALHLDHLNQVLIELLLLLHRLRCVAALSKLTLGLIN